MIIRVLHNLSKPAVIAVSYPIRAGKFSNSNVPIPDWIECGAGRFTPIHTSLEVVRSPRGPRQSEWRQKLLSMESTLHVFCCSADKDMSINRSNRIATPRNTLFLLDRGMNTFSNEICGFFYTYLQDVVTSVLYYRFLFYLSQGNETVF
jgi:hypothetical protein